MKHRIWLIGVALLMAALVGCAAAPAADVTDEAPTEEPTEAPTEEAEPTDAPTEVAEVTAEPTEPPTPTPPPHEILERTDEFGVEQVYVPAGCFMMGANPEVDELAGAFPAEQPAHETCLTQGYWIDKYEATNANWQAFVDAGGYTTPELWSQRGAQWLARQDLAGLPYTCDTDEPDYPRTCITWYEAEAYAAWRGGSLPTEAQWEWAARGPELLIYPWGNEWDATLANVTGSAAAKPVGSYPEGASWVGAMDMSGNAMEWVQDWFSRMYYGDAPKDDPTGPEQGSLKVERGGWYGGRAEWARTTYRHNEDGPEYQDHHIGVRVVTPEE